MSAPSTCMLHLRKRIRSLQSTGIDKIWMKVSGNGDFTMANVLGFLDSDLVLLLKTIGLITHLRTKLIILTHGAPGLEFLWSGININENFGADLHLNQNIRALRQITVKHC